MRNSELISIYQNYCKVLVSISFDWNDVDKSEYFLNRTQEVKKSFIDYFKDVDFRRFNEDELKIFGFSAWDEELLLCPSWVIDTCSDGTVLTSINGGKATKGKDSIDTDTRFGVTAWGFLFSELRDYKLSNIID